MTLKDQITSIYSNVNAINIKDEFVLTNKRNIENYTNHQIFKELVLRKK